MSPFLEIWRRKTKMSKACVNPCSSHLATRAPQVNGKVDSTQGHDPDAPEQENDTQTPRANIVEHLLATAPRFLNMQDQDGTTAVHLAAMSGYVGFVQSSYLFFWGFLILELSTPLAWKCRCLIINVAFRHCFDQFRRRYPRCLQLLLDAKANITVRDSVRGLTALEAVDRLHAYYSRNMSAREAAAWAIVARDGADGVDGFQVRQASLTGTVAM